MGPTPAIDLSAFNPFYQLPILIDIPRGTQETSLFGTLSLWQGVDVPGPSLSLVLIDRIPFPRPDDPLLGARQRAVAARGGNGFMAVAASHAALLLAQGYGYLSIGDAAARCACAYS